MDKAQVQLIELMRFALNGNDRSLAPAEQIDWAPVLKLAAQHSLINVVAAACANLPEGLCPSQEQRAAIDRHFHAMIAQESAQLYAAEQLMQAFEARGLYVMPIKGVVTKGRYSETYMRSMSDIDLLYKPEQDKQVKEAMKELGYGGFSEGQVHDHYSMEPYLSVEMHRQLTRADSEHSAYYEDIWQRCRPKDGCKYVYEMSVEDEFIYNFVHFCKHFLFGGVGVRFVMDIYVYDQSDIDRRYIEKELKKLNLWRFYVNVSRLAQVWFGKAEQSDAVTQEMAEFIVNGGLFGTKENAAAAKVSEGRVGGFLRACFPSYSNTVSMFPWLKRCPLLLPYCWLLRAIRAALHRKQNIRNRFSYALADKDAGRQIAEFYKRCGL